MWQCVDNFNWSIVGPKDRQEMGKRMSNTSESSNGGDNGESSEEGNITNCFGFLNKLI